jgi:hypothetical protein
MTDESFLSTAFAMALRALAGAVWRCPFAWQFRVRVIRERMTIARRWKLPPPGLVAGLDTFAFHEEAIRYVSVLELL